MVVFIIFVVIRQMKRERGRVRWCAAGGHRAGRRGGPARSLATAGTALRPRHRPSRFLVRRPR